MVVIKTKKNAIYLWDVIGSIHPPCWKVSVLPFVSLLSVAGSSCFFVSSCSPCVATALCFYSFGSPPFSKFRLFLFNFFVFGLRCLTLLFCKTLCLIKMPLCFVTWTLLLHFGATCAPHSDRGAVTREICKLSIPWCGGRYLIHVLKKHVYYA